MRRRSNAGLFERLRGPSSVSYGPELRRRRAEAKKQARTQAMRDLEREREELRREREQIRAANKQKRLMLAEERREEQKRRKEEAREAPHKAIPSAAAIQRAYDQGAKSLSEAMEMAKRNPASYRGQSVAALERMLIYANARAYDNDWMVRMQGRKDVEAIEHALKNARKREAKKAPNPRGKKGAFSRCVKAVSQRKGAKDPEAICAAQERKRGLINPVDYNESYVTSKSKAAGLAQKKLKAGYRWAEVSQQRSGRNKGKYRVEYGTSSLMAPGLKTNPAASAQAVSEEFHGRPVREMVPVQQKRHYHKYLAELGELRKLEVLARDGKHRVTLTKFDHAMLCTNEDKNQLFIVDGDQSVNLKDFGIKDPHEIETLGEVTKIEYFTDKEHLGSEGGTAVYVHKFRTTNGNSGHKTVRMARNPDLIYYLRDDHLEFSGGSYFIRAEGIDQ